MRVKKLSILIPVYNEKDTIKQIIKKIIEVDLGSTEKELIIVDDGSTDGTVELLKKIAQENPQYTLCYHEANQGKGASLKDGFARSTGDYVIVQDADLEYDPEDYSKLLSALEYGDVDVIYGSRFSGNYKDMSNLHYFGNKVLTLLTNILYGVLLTDMETCYKLLPGNFVRTVDIKSKRFNFEPEITAKILKSGMRIKEVPIKYSGRSFTEGKKITWKDGMSALFTLIKFRFVN